MIIAIDIGNTNITWGVYDGEELLFVSRLATDRSRTKDQYALEIREILKMQDVRADHCAGAIISSVVPELTNSLRQAIDTLIGVKPLVVGPGVKSGLDIRIDNPKQLGADLVAGAVGAMSKYPLPCLIIDLGTATKISVLDAKGSFLGCTISAGVFISLNALATNASQLHGVSLEAPKNIIGTDTISSMQAGTVLGTAAMLDGLCDRIEDELGAKVATVVATGGISGDIVRYCRRNVITDKNLILHGLKVLYEKNV